MAQHELPLPEDFVIARGAPAQYDLNLISSYWSAHGDGLRAAGKLLLEHDALPATAQFALNQEASHDYTRSRNAENEYNATHDELTGLLNRRGLAEKLDDLPPNAKVGALYCDVTNFKAINDLISHESGDALLCDIADTFRKVFRKNTIIARIGGDEFLILFVDVPESNELRDDQEENEEPERRIEKGMRQQIHEARDRLQQEMLPVIEKHSSPEVLGLQLAVGTAEANSRSTIRTLKADAEAEMKHHKRAQHSTLGRYRQS